MADLYSRIMSRGLPNGVRHVEHKTTQTIQHTTFRDVSFSAAINTQQWSPQNVRDVLTQHLPTHTVPLQLPTNPQPTAQFLAFVQHTQPDGKLLVSDIVRTLTQRTEEITIVVERERTYHFTSLEVRAGLVAIMQKASPEQLVNTDIRQLLADTIRRQQHEQQTQPDINMPAQSTQQLIMAQKQQSSANGATEDSLPKPLSIDGQFEAGDSDINPLTAPITINGGNFKDFKDATA